MREAPHHFAARLRAASFQKTHVATRYLGFGRERELARAPHRAPLTQQGAELWAVALLYGHVHASVYEIRAVRRLPGM